MPKQITSINLIRTDQNNLTNQVVNWALTIGRLLIIIVEIIALSAFLYRFILDNQIRDLNSKIKVEEQILNEQKDKELNYRNLQDRLNLEASIINQANNKVKQIKDIISLTPPGINFTNLTYTKNQISIQLNTGSVFPLSIFINSLKNYSSTNYISIDLVENKASSSSINVGLTISLKNKGVYDANTGN